jgi:putative nucleotidyltransferase with HDIG domain
MVIPFMQLRYDICNVNSGLSFQKLILLDQDNDMHKSRQIYWIKLLFHLSKHIDSRICNGGCHSLQVAHWAKSTARALGCSESSIRNTYWAALFHDIGKISVPSKVLSKAGPLTSREWDVMKLHPTVGSNIIRSLDLISNVASIIYAHQEKYDGSGYPEGLAGEQIPLEARILSVVDAYEAMTNERAYSRARSPVEARQELCRFRGRQFDPIVVNEFLKVLDSGSTHGNGCRSFDLENKKTSVPTGTKDFSAVPPWLPKIE